MIGEYIILQNHVKEHFIMNTYKPRAMLSLLCMIVLLFTSSVTVNAKGTNEPPQSTLCTTHSYGNWEYNSTTGNAERICSVCNTKEEEKVVSYNVHFYVRKMGLAIPAETKDPVTGIVSRQPTSEFYQPGVYVASGIRSFANGSFLGLGDFYSIDGYLCTQPDITKFKLSRFGIDDTKYTIQWYVVKYDIEDGWHVDGILEPKVDITPIPTPSATPIPSATPTPSVTVTPTVTPTPSVTPIVTPSPSPTPLATPTPIATLTPVPSPSLPPPSSIPTPMPTTVPTEIPTIPTDTPTPTPEPTQPPVPPTEPPTRPIDTPAPPTEIPVEPTEVPTQPEKPVIIDEDPVPTSEDIEEPPVLPKTGTIPPMIFYGIGSLMTWAGHRLMKRRKR